MESSEKSSISVCLYKSIVNQHFMWLTTFWNGIYKDDFTIFVSHYMETFAENTSLISCE